MKETRLRNEKGQFKKASKVSEFGFVNLSTYTSPEIKEVNGEEWIEYGADNNYFQYLIDRYNGSPTNNAAINGISQAIYGKGLNATDGNRKPNEYAQMISLFKKDVVRKLCYDLKLMGQCAIQIIYSKDRKKIAQLEHMPIETLRAEKANEDGDIPAYYYFKDWANIKRSDDPLRIPAYGMSKENIEIFYIKPYKSGFYYYSPVDYQGGLQYAELEEEVSNYHLNNIMNGLSPSMLINFNNGTPNQEERRLIENKIAQKFSGTSNAGKFILAFNDNKDSQAEITPVQLSDAHNQYQFLSEESQSKIQVAHRVVSPFLLGIRTSSGFSSNADEIKTASLLMDNTVIRPFQELLIDSFDNILAYNDISLNLYFTTLQPLEFTEVDSSIQGKEEIEEETGVEMQKFNLKMIDGKQAYKTKEEAEAKAKEMGCGGSHEHEVEGVVYYMPCVSHEELKAPCWDGYEQVGTKMKDGREVPNCVPLKKESEVPKLSDEQGSLILEHLQGETVNDEWIITDVRDVYDENLSDEEWVSASLVNKETTLSKIKKLVGLADQIKSKNNGSSYSDLDSKNYKIRYQYYKKSSAKSIQKDADGKRKSTYETRDFCKNMMQLSSSGVVYTIEDIDKASRAGINGEFSASGQETYNLFKFKGGCYCRHAWKQILYRRKKGAEVSENLKNYRRTGDIPPTYKRNPWGSKDAKKATFDLPNHGSLKYTY
jgi:hypothetical protein